MPTRCTLSAARTALSSALAVTPTHPPPGQPMLVCTACLVPGNKARGEAAPRRRHAIWNRRQLRANLASQSAQAVILCPVLPMNARGRETALAEQGKG